MSSGKRCEVIGVGARRFESFVRTWVIAFANDSTDAEIRRRRRHCRGHRRGSHSSRQVTA